MTRILTITMNPSVDVSTTVERVIPSSKLRCGPARRDPGGGGINVARVAKRLGADVVALYTAGGEKGQLLRRLIGKEGLEGISLPISEETREDFTVDEATSGQEFRFVSPGPTLNESEWRATLAMISELRFPFDFVVASGSLPPGVPDDFYAQIAAIAKAKGAPFALDASGPALRGALRAAVDVLKPSLSELRDLTGLPLGGPSACVGACKRLVDQGAAKIVALTLGSQGAIVVSADEVLRAWPLSIHVVSTVGAGDSFLAAFICALGSGRSLTEAFRRAVAAGTAALIAPGTQLCRVADVDEFESHVHIDRMNPVLV
jgi:6-phosphofructokinase 2